MATRWNAEMQERLEKVEVVVGEFRTRFAAVDQRFDAVDRRFDGIDSRLDDLEQRLNTKIDVQVEHIEALVRTTADNFAGVLSGISRELKEFRSEMQEQSRLTNQILANHEQRLTTLERRRRT
jgi:hypothetical protein